MFEVLSCLNRHTSGAIDACRPTLHPTLPYLSCPVGSPIVNTLCLLLKHTSTGKSCVCFSRPHPTCLLTLSALAQPATSPPSLTTSIHGPTTFPSLSSHYTLSTLTSSWGLCGCRGLSVRNWAPMHLGQPGGQRQSTSLSREASYNRWQAVGHEPSNRACKETTRTGITTG